MSLRDVQGGVATLTIQGCWRPSCNLGRGRMFQEWVEAGDSEELWLICSKCNKRRAFIATIEANIGMFLRDLAKSGVTEIEMSDGSVVQLPVTDERLN